MNKTPSLRQGSDLEETGLKVRKIFISIYLFGELNQYYITLTL